MPLLRERLLRPLSVVETATSFLIRSSRRITSVHLQTPATSLHQVCAALYVFCCSVPGMPFASSLSVFKSLEIKCQSFADLASCHWLGSNLHCFQTGYLIFQIAPSLVSIRMVT